MVPKRHVADLEDLTKEEQALLIPTVLEVFEILCHPSTDLRKIYQEFLDKPINAESEWLCRRALSHPGIDLPPDGHNGGYNDGRVAGRTLDHFHWHIIPRYEGDVLDPTGGVRHIIPGMGNYKRAK